MFNFNNNLIFGYFASSGGISESLFQGTTAQSIYRDFVTSPLLNGVAPTRIGPDLKLTRPDPGSYYNSNGIIIYALSGQPRFDYSPNGTYRGLLIEDTKANSLRYSTDFTKTVTWNIPVSTDGAGITLTSVATVSAPDNSLTVTLLSARPAVGFRAIVGTPISTNPGYTTRSVFIKQDQGRYVLIGAIDPAQNPATYGGGNLQVFDFETENFVSFPEGGSLGEESQDWLYVEKHPNGWYRIGASRNASSVPISKLYIGTALTSSWSSGFYTNTNNRDSFYIWGAQIENGTHISSYIPTSGAAVTRAADNIATTRLSAFNVYNIQQSTFFVKGSRLNTFLPGSFASFAQNDNNYWSLAAKTTIPGAIGTFRSTIGQGIYVDYVPNTDFLALTSVNPVSNTPYTLIGSLSSNFQTTLFYYAQDQTLVSTYPLSTEYQTWNLITTTEDISSSIPGSWSIYNGPNNEEYFTIIANNIVQQVSSYNINANDRILTFTSVTSLPIGTAISGVQLVKEYNSPVGLDPKPTTFRLGQQFNTNYLNGHIQEFGYWPTYIPFNTLSAILYPTP
jgi:hypothetical protein